MPRRDGTGPLGNGPHGWGRGSCQRGRGVGGGLGRIMRGCLPFGVNASKTETLEAQAKRLEKQAAHLRNLATQSRTV